MWNKYNLLPHEPKEALTHHSLEAETSERVLCVKLFRRIMFKLFPEQVKRDISVSICMHNEKSGIVGNDNYSDNTCIPNMWKKKLQPDDWAERELNTSLVLETSERVIFRKFQNLEQWKNKK